MQDSVHNAHCPSEPIKLCVSESTMLVTRRLHAGYCPHGANCQYSKCALQRLHLSPKKLSHQVVVGMVYFVIQNIYCLQGNVIMV